MMVEYHVGIRRTSWTFCRMNAHLSLLCSFSKMTVVHTKRNPRVIHQMSIVYALFVRTAHACTFHSWLPYGMLFTGAVCPPDVML